MLNEDKDSFRHFIIKVARVDTDFYALALTA